MRGQRAREQERADPHGLCAHGAAEHLREALAAHLQLQRVRDREHGSDDREPPARLQEAVAARGEVHPERAR